jgi:hypothetical protein
VVHGVEVAFEIVEARLPQRPVGSEPRVDGAQWLGPDAIEATLGVRTDVDEAGVAQDPEVLRHGWLADAEGADEVAHGPLGQQQVEQTAPVRLGDYLERGDSPTLPNSYITVKTSTPKRAA